MKHVKKDGTNNKVIITLHGTGGSATDLFQIASFIDPQATLIGFQGEVLERGMARYFKRHADGSFDYQSLLEATHDLHESIQHVIKEYDLSSHQITLMGYSNGANLAQSYLKEYSNVGLDLALLLHPSPTRMDEAFKTQERVRVLITSGLNDPYITKEEFELLEQQYQDAHIDVIAYQHSYGHQLIQEELTSAKELYEQINL